MRKIVRFIPFTSFGNVLPEDYSLFLENILETDSCNIHSASPVMIADWIKANMGNAGIDTTISNVGVSEVLIRTIESCKRTISQ